MPPAYDRPFGSPGDTFCGEYEWTAEMTEFLGPHQYVYHGCHEPEFAAHLANGALNIISDWSLVLANNQVGARKGVWATFNNYGWSLQGNFFGPLLMEFPLSVINGKKFLVWTRSDHNRRRYVFLEKEAGVNYALPPANANNLTLRQLWEEGDGYYGTIRDLVLTGSDTTSWEGSFPRASGGCVRAGYTTAALGRGQISGDRSLRLCPE